jgi:hypothetical protein
MAVRAQTVGDYTKIFKNPDELADFMMREVEEQDAYIAKLAEEGKLEGAEMSCDLNKKAAMAKEPGKELSAKDGGRER